MIIREESDIIFIEQHEHALISGQFINKWRENLFTGLEWKPSVEYAVSNHDRSWIPLDRKFMYLPEKDSLASFIDFPLKKKIEAYEAGIEQLLKEDPYAGYLISCHYASFFKDKEDPLSAKFINHERIRQDKILKRIFKQEKKFTREIRDFHFDLLQFCDNLSLYLCMNRWGAKKNEEVTWFKDGFTQQLATLDKKRVYANWESETTISLNPFPFEKERVHVSIPYKRLTKQETRSDNIRQIYRDAPYESHPVVIVNAKQMA
ncbi:DUF3891 family protein [Salipaludibacillus sp. HK11]|uniref:DUF3891 family protein n=1 Tax=Salipaludibacillus sp. HK11 TaxID=3394320 RepID=UPI0039FBE6D3